MAVQPNMDPELQADAGLSSGLDGRQTAVAQIPLVHALRFQRPHVLEQIRGPGSPRVLELTGTDLVLGRSPECPLQIVSPALSRQHLRFRKLPGGYKLHDLDSANGVFLNGLRVHGAVLREGDLVQLGDVVLIYHEGK